jgi:ubiquinone/menaquinone biosynthesis C-methylase UbiE
MRNTSSPETKGHPWYAATYDFLTQWSERRVMRQIRPFVAGTAQGDVLEIGTGTGANFPYYDRSQIHRLVAIEPDPFFLRRAQQRARELGLAVEFYPYPAEAIALPDRTFDTVVATLVFCSVEDPRRALAEVKRVLKPDGRFHFLEHVRSDDSWAGRVQDLVTPTWQHVAGGCQLNRRTEETIRAAGFEIAWLQERHQPLMRLIFGVARPLPPSGGNAPGSESWLERES